MERYRSTPRVNVHIWYLLVLIEVSCRKVRHALFPTPTGKTMAGKRLR
jgi:hypothetical protein